MTYATTTDLERRFGAEVDQLIDRNNDGYPDPGVFLSASMDADAVVDGYLATRYSLPLVETPALVVQIACDVTRYNLWDDRAPQEVRTRYEDAISKLKDISKGVIKLVLQDTGEVKSATVGQAEPVSMRTRRFDDDTLSGFMGR